MKPFEELFTDTVTLQKSDGTVVKNVKVSIGEKEVSLLPLILKIETGDKMVRDLQSGKADELIIEKAEYAEEFHGVPAQWILKYRRSK